MILLAPCNTPEVMYYVYVIRSQRDKHFYVGFTSNLKKRLKTHNDGLVESTKLRKPFDVVYYEACVNKQDAVHRERYLKSTYGKRYIRNRISNYLREESD